MSLDLRGRYPASQTILTAGSSRAAEICARRQSPNRVGHDSKAETTTRGARFLRLRHNTLCSLRRSSSRTGCAAPWWHSFYRSQDVEVVRVLDCSALERTVRNAVQSVLDSDWSLADSGTLS